MVRLVKISLSIFNGLMHIFLLLSGMYADDVGRSEQALFITERHTLVDLEGLASPCPCGMTRNPWMLDSVTQVCAYVNVEV